MCRFYIILREVGQSECDVGFINTWQIGEHIIIDFYTIKAMIKFLKLTQQNYVLPPTPYYRRNMEPS
jgi:hypothetical protein